MHLPFSTAVVFYVQNGHPYKIIKASDVAQVLRLQLLKEKPDFLLFKVLRVDTAGRYLNALVHGRKYKYISRGSFHS